MVLLKVPPPLAWVVALMYLFVCLCVSLPWETLAFNVEASSRWPQAQFVNLAMAKT